jgi:hypothetical protein
MRMKYGLYLSSNLFTNPSDLIQNSCNPSTEDFRKNMPNHSARHAGQKLPAGLQIVIRLRAKNLHMQGKNDNTTSFALQHKARQIIKAKYWNSVHENSGFYIKALFDEA